MVDVSDSDDDLGGSLCACALVRMAVCGCL